MLGSHPATHPNPCENPNKTKSITLKRLVHAKRFRDSSEFPTAKVNRVDRRSYATSRHHICTRKKTHQRMLDIGDFTAFFVLSEACTREELGVGVDAIVP